MWRKNEVLDYLIEIDGNDREGNTNIPRPICIVALFIICMGECIAKQRTIYKSYIKICNIKRTLTT